MYGNGWPGPTASGVRIGKISLSKTPLELLQLLRLEVLDLGATTIPAGRELRPQVALPELRLLRRERRWRAPGSPPASACGVSPSGNGTVTPARDLIHQARDADHEELVHVRGEDRAEVDPLEQRQRDSSLASVEHAAIEVQLRQFPVEEPRLRLGGAYGHDCLSSRAGRAQWVNKWLIQLGELVRVCSAATTFAGSGANWSFAAEGSGPGPIA